VEERGKEKGLHLSSYTNKLRQGFPVSNRSRQTTKKKKKKSVWGQGGGKAKKWKYTVRYRGEKIKRPCTIRAQDMS